MGRDYNRFRELHQWYLSWRSLPGGDPADRARIELSNTVRTAFIWGDQRAAQEGFARLEAIAAAADDPALVPLVRFVSGALAFLRLDDTAVDTMRGAVDEILRTGDWRRLSAWGAAYAAALALSGQLSLATDFSERLLGDVPEDATGWLAAPAGYAVMYSVLQGRAESVSRYAGIAIRSVAGSYNTNEALAFAGNAFVSSAVGDHESARATIDAVVERMRADGTLINLAWSGLVRAWLCWRAGEPWDAAAANEAHRIFGRHYGGAWLMALRARHLVEEDAVADAVGTARDAVAAAAATRYAAVSRPVAQLALAEALLVVGEPADAANAAHEALRLALEQDQQWAIAEAFDDLARIAAAFGERLDSARLVGASDRVREEINWVRGVPDGAAISALDIDEAARAEGMQMSRDEAIAFAARGRGKRRRSTFGWSALTPTELDVVRLVAEGRRNNDIAEKLLMSPATVKTHLTHVFAKLGVSNRAELTAQAVERSLTTN
jgi:DNA-binding CsgD family transcriptional regulator